MTSIRKKIVANTVAIVLILAATVVGILFVTTRYMTESIMLNVLKPLVRTASQTVEGNLHLLADRLYLISDNHELTNPQTPRDEKKALLERMVSGIEFLSLTLYDSDGYREMGEGDAPADISGESIYKKMKETGYLVIDDTHTLANGDLQITIGTPVLDSEGNTISYLVGCYKYDVLNDVMTNINLGRTGGAYIFNQEGRLMASPDRAKVAEGSNVLAGLDQGEELYDRMARASTGEIGAARLKMNGEATFLAYAPVRGTNWTICIAVPRADFMQIGNRAILWTLLVVLLPLTAALIRIRRFSRKISDSLGSVTGRIQRLSEGDLASPVEVFSTRDEAETLAAALRETVGDINGYLGELRDTLSRLSEGNLDVTVSGEFAGDFVVMKDSLNRIIEYLNNVMNELQTVSAHILSESLELAGGAQRVNNSSERQAASVTHLRSESDTIFSNIRMVNDHAQQAEVLMERVNDQLAQGGRQMELLLTAMDRIDSNAKEIGKIAKLMEDISFQTNLLALNASVEAAHAGSAGKGFSVVAEQVRLLANQSAESAQKTGEMLEHSQRQVAEGLDFANQSARTMGKIEEISKEVTKIMEGLVSSVQRQEGALDEIIGEINEISSLSDQNLNESAEAAAASQQMTQQAEALKRISEQFNLRKNQSDSVQV